MVTHYRRGLAIAILLFASFVDLMDVTIVQVALPQISASLSATSAQLEWVVSGYMLAFALGLITGGRLGDLYGRRRTFLWGMAGFTVTSLLAAISPAASVLVAARVVQGLFAATMVPQLLATIQALYEPKERAPMFGMVGAVAGLAAVIGPVLGGWLVATDLAGLGWRMIFLVNVPIGIVIIVLGVRNIPETRSDRPMRLDLLGVGLLTVIMLAFMVPLVQGHQWGWPRWLWLPVVVGALSVVLFIRVSNRRMRRDGSALLPLRLFRDRGFSAGVLVQALFQGAVNAFTLPFMLYLQFALGLDALTAGLNLVAFSLGAMLGTGAVVPLVARVGKYLVTVGAAMMAAGTLWLLVLTGRMGQDFSAWEGIWPMLLTGLGLACLIIPLVDVALATVPVADAGAASGALTTFQQLGAASGVAIATTAYFGTIGGATDVPGMHAGLTAALLVSAGGFVLAGIMSLLLPSGSQVRARLDQQQAAAKANLEDIESATAPGERGVPGM